ncbi:unnamed protein product [Urochloa decumbens]|uniref:TF-B3 domain-containing protein n=1 Tax=Urochloa decumbens TaxID=240449 RepID=A0ABC8Y0F0_9POAL
MNIVCEVCGDIGFRHLLLCCGDCKCSATHQYCLEKIVFDASLIKWFCNDCLQRRGEVACIRSLEKVPSEILPSNAHFGSIVHQSITKRVESARDAGLWRNRKSKSFVTKYASLNKSYSPQKKRSKDKSNMRSMGNCTNGGGRIVKIAAHTSAKASYSYEIIRTESVKSNNGKNQQVDHENPATLNINQPSPLIVNCLGTSGDTDQSHLLETMEELACKSNKNTKGLVMDRENAVLGSNKLGSSCYTAVLGNSVLEKSGGNSNNTKDSGANHDSMAANVPQPSRLQNDAVDRVMPYSLNDGCEEVFSCSGIKNIPSVRERSVDSIDISSIPEHDITEAPESSERFTDYHKGSSCRRRNKLKMAASSSSSEESGEYIPSESVSLASDDLQSSLRADYVLSYRTYLSEAQKKRVMALIQETQPEFTVYIATMRKTNVQPPGPYLGITKEYALAHCPDQSTTVTLEMPGRNKKWHPKFYKKDESRKNFLMGQWLDFVRDNHVQEGDIVLLLPTKGGDRSTFTVYLLHETAIHSSTKMASEVHIEEEPATGEHVSQESDTHDIPHESLESEDSSSPFLPEYFVPCKSPLSKSQKRIVEKRVRAIRSEVPLCVAVMKNNNVGVAQRWMLELGSRYASVYLPTKGQTLVLQCGGKTWETKMMFHNGRRWFINGGWPNFARGNGLRVGDICLFELKKEEKQLTMGVHIIRKELF